MIQDARPPLRAAACLILCIPALLWDASARAGTAATRRERERVLATTAPSTASLDRAHEAYLLGRDNEVERLTRRLSEPPDPDLLYLRALALDALGRPEESHRAFDRLRELSGVPEHRPAQHPPAVPTLDRDLSVHVGTFSSIKNASDLSARLKLSGRPSYTEEVAGRSLWRVYAGPYADEESASMAERALKAEGHPARLKRSS